ncbi:MAG: hypothetical protein JNL74_06080 [Fibrobacteres bacterium]|nr:hypothetical protein [Fibrobacterota bacterium]
MIKLLLLLAALICAELPVSTTETVISVKVDSVKYRHSTTVYDVYVTKKWELKYYAKLIVGSTDSCVFRLNSPSKRLTKAKYNYADGATFHSADTVATIYSSYGKRIVLKSGQTFTCTVSVFFKRTENDFSTLPKGVSPYVVFVEDSSAFNNGTFDNPVFGEMRLSKIEWSVKRPTSDSFRVNVTLPPASSTELNIAKKPTAFGKPIALFDVSGRRVEGVQRNGVYVEFDGRNYRKRTLLK